jgi:hypothetical protein
MLGSAALKKENPNYSNYDIREIVMKVASLYGKRLG